MKRVLFQVAVLLSASLAYGNDQCFLSSRAVNVDAQEIRQRAMSMGWRVRKTASLTAATIVDGKNKLYPKGDVEVCLQENDRHLQIKAQAKSKDAGRAEWHRIPAGRTGKVPAGRAELPAT